MIKTIISKEKPIIAKRCEEELGANWKKGTIFTVGNIIHCKFTLSKAKFAHEYTHVEQQTKMGVELWWDKYFNYTDFRLEQEVEAYRNEAKWIKVNIKNFKERDKMLDQICRDLSSPLYGNITSFEEAKELIL